MSHADRSNLDICTLHINAWPYRLPDLRRRAVLAAPSARPSPGIREPRRPAAGTPVPPQASRYCQNCRKPVMTSPFSRIRRTLAILGMIISGSVSGAFDIDCARYKRPFRRLRQRSAGLPAAQRAALPAEDFGPQAVSSSDEAVSGFGDSSGYHVQLGRQSGGFAARWRLETATLAGSPWPFSKRR